MAGFNKMFIMLPIMFAARKLDGEDPNVIYWLRICYFSVQTLIVTIVAYVYIQSIKAAKGRENRMIYVPPAPTPFADPNAKKKYTETTYGAHLVSQARSLLGSTLFGICLTSGLHFYRGMVIGLAIQSVMGPLNLVDNPMVKALLFSATSKKKTNGDSDADSSPFREEDKIFDEKTADELTPDDEVVDDAGNPVVRTIGSSANAATGAASSPSQSFEELLLDTWDAGAKADIGPLMKEINKKNCNFSTKESSWTPIMILSGLAGVKGTPSAIRQVIALGGNPAMTDVEGWNAMHWAAFHGSADAARVLSQESKVLLYDVKDKEGKKPIDHARAENNDDVCKILEELEQQQQLQQQQASSSTSDKNDEGLRKRK